MRYSLFTAEKDTDTNVEACRIEVQAACDKAHVAGQPRIIICPFQALGKWVVAAPVEPVMMLGAVVETVEVLKIEESITEEPKEEPVETPVAFGNNNDFPSGSGACPGELPSTRAIGSGT